MEEYKYDEESVNALVKWAETATFPEQVMLSDAENIFDVKRYVRANLSDIAAHYPDEFYNPAITRLYRLKDKMEGKEGVSKCTPSLFYVQSPDFHKLGLCYYLKILYL